MQLEKSQGAQRSPEVALRSTDFRAPKNLIFPALYDMYVHVFGGISLSGCCNYVFRKTVANNGSDFKVGGYRNIDEKLLC